MQDVLLRETKTGSGKLRTWRGVGVGIVLLLSWACATQAPPPPAPEPNRGQAFSAERAWQHLLALSAIGPRASGTDGAKQAREYIQQQLQGMGLQAEVQSAEATTPSGPMALQNLIVTIPGASPDLFLLSTHYDTHPKAEFPLIGANEGASGVAVLLELARVYAAQPFSYTVQVSFIDGDVLRGEDAKALPDLLPGSVAWVKGLKDQGLLSSARFALLLDQVGDRDLVFTRDLFSNRSYRETFWSTAQELGYQKTFPASAKFESIGMGHRILDAAGMRLSVALADSRYGDGDSPGKFWRSAQDTPENNSQDSLEIVGRVSLVAIEKIAQRLQRIDSLMVRGPAPESVAPAVEAKPTADAVAPTAPSPAPSETSPETEIAPPSTALSPDASAEPALTPSDTSTNPEPAAATESSDSAEPSSLPETPESGSAVPSAP